MVYAENYGQLFDCSADNIGLHLKNIYESEELVQEATTEYFSVVQTEGERQVNRKLKFYNLDAIISVGYRVNSTRATQFRQWCTYVLRQFAIRGYVIDKKRMENGSFISEDYFEHLLAEIREIRLIVLSCSPTKTINVKQMRSWLQKKWNLAPSV